MGADSGGMRHGHIEVMLIAFDYDGNILNIVKKGSKLALEPKVYMATQAVGMQIHEEIDVRPANCMCARESTI